MTNRSYTRRTVLGTLTAAFMSLAGCTGDSGVAGQGSIITGVSPDGTSLVVSLAEGREVESITLIDPSGAEFATHSVATGATLLPFEIGTEYEPGVYHIIAARDNAEIDRVEFEIRPELEITEIAVGADVPESLPGDLEFGEEQILVSIENTGTGSDSATDLTITGGVPHPTDPNQKLTSGIYDSVDGFGEKRRVELLVGETTQLWSTTTPFLLTGSSDECRSEELMRTASVDLEFAVSEPVSQSIEVKYSAADSYRDCTVSIEGGN